MPPSIIVVGCIHPQSTYVRNMVVRPVTPDTPLVDAICEEGLAHLDDILDPHRFYCADSNSGTFEANRAAINEDIPKFLDAKRSQTAIMREHRIRELRHSSPG